MNRLILTKVGVFVGIFAIFFFMSFGLYRATNSGTPSMEGYTDELSGEDINMTAAVGDSGPNPSMPYSVGFENLKTYGISNDDVRYIQDAISHHVVYDEGLVFAKVSFVKDSFHYIGPIGDVTSHYGFSFGINGGDIHKADIASNIVDKTIAISFSKQGKTDFSRKYTLYQL